MHEWFQNPSWKFLFQEATAGIKGGLRKIVSLEHKKSCYYKPKDSNILFLNDNFSGNQNIQKLCVQGRKLRKSKDVKIRSLNNHFFQEIKMSRNV